MIQGFFENNFKEVTCKTKTLLQCFLTFNTETEILKQNTTVFPFIISMTSKI